jgi:periplasmic divalent cation tolerance protein
MTATGKTDARIVLVTASDETQALALARALVERKLAACVNITGRVRSVFRWQGKVEEAQEHILIIKSRAALVDRLVRAVRELHSYDTPEVIAIPIVAGFRPYLDWLIASTPVVRRGGTGRQALSSINRTGLDK